jgi:hypothetical protein
MRWGRIKSVSALLLTIIFFGVAAALVISLVKLNGEGFILFLFLFLPGVFFLTNEIPLAIFELVFEVTPRFMNRPISFEVGEGLRLRGVLRGAVAIGFIMVAFVMSIDRDSQMRSPPNKSLDRSPDVSGCFAA